MCAMNAHGRVEGISEDAAGDLEGGVAIRCVCAMNAHGRGEGISEEDAAGDLEGGVAVCVL